MSLYANLLKPKTDSAASISSGPVLYDNGEKDDIAKKEANSGTLQLVMSFILAVGLSRGSG